MDEWMDGNWRNPTGPWNLNISTQVLSKVPLQIFLSGDHHSDLRLRITRSLSYALLLTASQGPSLSRHVLLSVSSLWRPEVYRRIPVSWSPRELCRHRLATSAMYTLRTCVGASDSPPRTRWSSSVPSEVWFRCSSPMSVCVYGKYWNSEPNVSRQKQRLEKLNHRQPVVEKDLAGRRGQAASSSAASRPRPASKEPHPGVAGLLFPLLNESTQVRRKTRATDPASSSPKDFSVSLSLGKLKYYKLCISMEKANSGHELAPQILSGIPHPSD